MAVYVDILLKYEFKGAPKCFNSGSCHMYADSLEELHDFAKKLGLKRSWFQETKLLNHYDLVLSKRKLAVKLGAIEHNWKEAVTKWREIRGVKS